MSGKGFSKTKEKFKKLHKFDAVNGLTASPVPDPESFPVPSKILITVDGREIEIEPDAMKLIEMLGHGVHGHVDRMIHLPTSTIMAVKRIPWKLNAGDESKMLRRELDVSMQASSCPHVVKCYGALYKEGSVWICMEVMDTSLEKFYETVFRNPSQYSVMPESVIGHMAYCVISALHYLKQNLNVIHRDVKPSNILINRSGVVKICDFGISGKLVDSLARSHVGSRNYMAPERVFSEGQAGYDITSDVWSLGISVIEIATGIYPYNAWKTPFEQLEQVVKGEPPRLPSGVFSKDFEDFIEKCLQKDPRCRARYDELLQHRFIIQHANANIAEFVTEMIDKLDIHRKLSP